MASPALGPLVNIKALPARQKSETWTAVHQALNEKNYPKLKSPEMTVPMQVVTYRGLTIVVLATFAVPYHLFGTINTRHFTTL